MRHVYMRGILGVVWMGAAIASLVMGNFSMLGLFGLMSGVYMYSAYNSFKKENAEK